MKKFGYVLFGFALGVYTLYTASIHRLWYKQREMLKSRVKEEA